jgi:hypothetical protein
VPLDINRQRPKFPEGQHFLRTEVCVDFRDADADRDYGCRTEWLNFHYVTFNDIAALAALAAVLVVAAILLIKRPPFLKVLAGAATIAFVILCLSGAYYLITEVRKDDRPRPARNNDGF